MLSRCPTLLARLNAQSGFMLIELMVVVSIITVLMSFGFISLQSARAAANSSQLVLDAQWYLLAIDEFKSHHGGRAPFMSGAGLSVPGMYEQSTEWTTTNAVDLAAGPISRLSGKPYLQVTPASVKAGAIRISWDVPEATLPTSVLGVIRYARPTVATSDRSKYALMLYRRGNLHGGAFSKLCVLGDLTVANTRDLTLPVWQACQ